MLDHTVTAEMAIQGVALEEVEVMEDQVGWTVVMVELVTTIHEVDVDLGMMMMGHFNLAPGRGGNVAGGGVLVNPTLDSVLVKDMEEVEVILMTTKRVAVQDVSFLS